MHCCVVRSLKLTQPCFEALPQTGTVLLLAALDHPQQQKRVLQRNAYRGCELRSERSVQSYRCTCRYLQTWSQQTVWRNSALLAAKAYPAIARASIAS